MATTTNDAVNVIIKDVELHWAKLDKPVEPFGTLQYELQIQAPKKREKELTSFGKVKPIDGGKVSINLKKKAIKADGTDAVKVRVVDNAKNPLDSKLIGNGSIGNVMVMQKPYEIKAPNGKVTKSGISSMLIAVQVTKLVKYERNNENFVDFDATESDDTDTSSTEESPF
jgi:hypothetical protein